MRFLKRLVLFVVIVAGAIWFWGTRLPREHVATSTVTLVAPADSVWLTVADMGSQPTWWKDMKSAKRLKDRPGEVWEEDMGPGGVLKIQVKRDAASRTMTQTILDEDGQGWGGVWTVKVRSNGSSTEVSLTEEGYVDPAIFRVMMKVRGPHTTLDSYLKALGAKFGETVTPKRS